MTHRRMNHFYSWTESLGFSRQEGRRRHVLPRVSAALAQFIAPISTPTASKKEASPQTGSFERFSPPPKENQSFRNPNSSKHSPPQENGGERRENQQNLGKESPQAQVIPLHSNSPTKELPPGISTALLQLMHVLKNQRTAILRWIGVDIYQSAPRLQKKSGRARKGTILDEKAN